MSETKPETAEITAHRRRLAALRERAALQGNQTDPAVIIEIEDIERRLRELGGALDVPPAADAQPWWTQIAAQARGDVIIAQVGANAQGVAVGKQITQQIGGDAEAEDAAVVAMHLQVAAAALAAATLDAAPRMMAEFQFNLLRAELKQRAPSSTTTVHVSDWLLGNVPALATPLRDLFTSSAGAQLLARAGNDAVAWAARCFPVG